MQRQYYNEFLKTLLSKRQIPIQGEINRTSFEMVSHSLMYLNAKDPDLEIKVLINSFGGSVQYGLAIYDAILSSCAPIVGIVTGTAHSMAAIILQGCKDRIATLNSKLCIHNISSKSEMFFKFDDTSNEFGDMDIEKIHSHLLCDEENMRSICKILSLKLEEDPSEVIDMLNSGKILSSKQALSIGLIDTII